MLENAEIVDLRHFSSAELRALLAHETEAWARMMAWDYRSSAEMILRYIDAKILPGYAAVQDGRVIGYTFFVYEGSKGVVGDLFVLESDAYREAETRDSLLTHGLETLMQTTGIHRIEAQLLTHPSGAVNRVFMEHGFSVHPRLFMELRLGGGAHTVSQRTPDIELRRWSENDFQPAAALITAAYAGHIDSGINDQYRSMGGSMRFLNNIVRFPGCGVFDGASSFVAVNRMTNQFAGLLLCSKVREDVGHVTQICVAPEQRGRGLGEQLMSTCVNTLQQRGFSSLTLTVTEDNQPAVALYERMGFDRRRVFDAFVWEG